MMRKFAYVAFALALAAPMAQAQTPNCESMMKQLQPQVASVTDMNFKQGLTTRWTSAETAMKAKDEKACMEHVVFIQRALKEGKM